MPSVAASAGGTCAVATVKLTRGAFAGIRRVIPVVVRSGRVVAAGRLAACPARHDEREEGEAAQGWSVAGVLGVRRLPKQRHLWVSRLSKAVSSPRVARRSQRATSGVRRRGWPFV